MDKVLCLLIVSLLSATAIATEPEATGYEKNAPKVEKRAKKTAICPTCGKPEAKCDCDEDGKKHAGEHENQKKSEPTKK